MGEVLAQRTIGYWIGHAGASLLFFVLLLISIARMLDVHLIELIKTIRKWVLDRIEQITKLKSQADTGPAVVAEVRPLRKQGRNIAADPVVAEEAPVDIRAMVEAQQQTAVERVEESKTDKEEKHARRKRAVKQAEPRSKRWMPLFQARVSRSLSEPINCLP